MVAIQDDVNILAIQDDGKSFQAMLLPTGHGGRRIFGEETGDKKYKMDLEACLVLPDGRLVAFGSGSTSMRERIVLANPLDKVGVDKVGVDKVGVDKVGVDEVGAGEVRVRDGRDLYADLRKTTAFSGSELNVEGAIIVDDRVRLFQRGNGAPTASLQPVNATGDLPLESFLDWLDRSGPAPHLENIRQYDLGAVSGVRLGFTDAALIPDGRIAFIACAEDSPDAIQDGAVAGACFGIIDNEDARITDILDESGSPAKLKLEGIEWIDDEREGDFLVVADMDSPKEPALLGRLLVRGLFDLK